MFSHQIRAALIAVVSLTIPTVSATAATPSPDQRNVTTQHLTVTAPASLATSSVHDWNGERYDVPSDLLRAPGVLINGLPPEPAQFD
jgi:hypothetical protein